MCSSYILLIQLEIVGTSDPKATKNFHKAKKKYQWDAEFIMNFLIKVVLMKSSRSED